jgi:hypothetical protein
MLPVAPPLPAFRLVTTPTTHWGVRPHVDGDNAGVGWGVTVQVTSLWFL